MPLKSSRAAMVRPGDEHLHWQLRQEISDKQSPV
jgi:hypothetical protein